MIKSKLNLAQIPGHPPEVELLPLGLSLGLPLGLLLGLPLSLPLIVNPPDIDIKITKF